MVSRTTGSRTPAADVVQLTAHWSRWPAAIATMAVASIVAASCSAADTTPGSGPGSTDHGSAASAESPLEGSGDADRDRPTPTAPDTNPTASDGPLLGLEDRWTLREAHAALVARCMRTAGFDGYTFEPTPFPRERLGTATAGIELRVAPPDQETFGLAESASDKDSGPPPDPYFESLSPDAKERYGDALFGSGTVELTEIDDGTITRPADGCLTQAENQLYEADDYFVLDSQRAALLAGVGPAVLADASFQELLSEYETCMVGAGFAAAAPWDAWDLVSTRLEHEGPTPEAVSNERAVATTDSECQQTIKYSSRAADVHARIIAELAEENPGLGRLVTIEQDALIRAFSLLEEAD